MSSIISELTNPDQVKTGLVLVKFWAPWCGPCKAFATTFENAAQGLAVHRPDLRSVSANVDDATVREYADRFGVRAIPYTLLVHDDKALWQQAGLIDGARLIGHVIKAIASIPKPTADQDL